MEIWINHISNILYYENYFANNVLNFVLRSYHIGDAIKIDEYDKMQSYIYQNLCWYLIALNNGDFLPYHH